MIIQQNSIHTSLKEHFITAAQLIEEEANNGLNSFSINQAPMKRERSVTEQQIIFPSQIEDKFFHLMTDNISKNNKR
jgi:hypothetical protein